MAGEHDFTPLREMALVPYEDCEESWGIVTNADGMCVGAQDVQNMARELRVSRAAIRDALRLLCVDQDRRGAFDRLAQAIGACDGCGGTGIAYDRRREDDAPLICCGGPQ